VVGAFAGVPSSALAGEHEHVSQAHKLGFSFGEPGSGAGQLALAGNSGVAVAPAGGSADDLFIADTANNRVSEFHVAAESNSATFVRSWGWGVANGEAKLETCGPGALPPTATCRAGLAGTGPGQLDGPAFVAVDNSCAQHVPVLTETTIPKCSEFDPSNGDVYVANAGEHLESPGNIVTRFTSKGELVESWGVKGQLKGSGEPKGAFGRPSGLAVDSAGTLFVYVGGTLEAGGSHMYEFGQEGKFVRLGPADVGSSDSPQGIAVDGFGDVFVSVGGSAVGVPGVGNVFDGGVHGFAVAPSTNDLYVDTGSAVGYVLAPGGGQCVLSQAGCALAQPLFGAPVLSGGGGVAVDPSGVVFVANSVPDQVSVFPVSMEAERVAASGVGATAATVNGEVNPDGGEVTKCRFEYGETRAYGKSAACEPAAPYTGKGFVKVHAGVAGLTGATSYHYRLHLVSAAGEELFGEDETVTTLPIAVVEEASTGSITSVWRCCTRW
jgi:hypothetical protein